MTRQRGLAGAGSAIGVLLTVGALAGCSSSHPASTVAPTGAPKSGTAPAAIQLKQNPLPSVLPTNQPAVRKDVVQTSCAAVPGGWHAAGYVKNSSATPKTYNILVYFTTTHATTLDFASASVRVAGGKTANWDATKRFAAQPSMLCPMPSISAS